MTALGIGVLVWIALNVAVFVWLTVLDLKSPLCTCGGADCGGGCGGRAK